MIYNNYKLPFDRLLEYNKQKSIHKKIKLLVTEIYKFQASLTPPIMSDLFFTDENNYNLRSFQELVKKTCSTNCKIWDKTISYRVPQMWILIPEK